MGRRIPEADDLSIYPTLSFSLLFVGMAAVVTLSTTLCGIRFRRRSEPKSSKFPPEHNVAEKLDIRISSPPSRSPLPQPPPPPPTTTKNEEEKTMLPRPPQAVAESQDTKEKETPQIKELPLPPAKQLRETNSTNHNMKKSASTRNLTMNLSMKMPRSLSLARLHQDREDKNIQKKNGKMKHEDSVWMKTIILGEKCKVPDEDEGVIYDGKGNRISTYHPKTSSSRPVSRQNSQIDPNAIPSYDRVARKEMEEAFS